jgi:hypothetical protein
VNKCWRPATAGAVFIPIFCLGTNREIVAKPDEQDEQCENRCGFDLDRFVAV